MPIDNVKTPGDNFYPQHQIVTTEPISNIATVKGNLYTKGGSVATGNQLVAVTTTGFANGLYQATRDVTAGTAGQNSVQCFGPGTRVGLYAGTANLHAGQKVKYNFTSHKIELWTGSTNLATEQQNEYIGRIFKIYTKENIAKEKDVTVIDDIAIVVLEV